MRQVREICEHVEIDTSEHDLCPREDTRGDQNNGSVSERRGMRLRDYGLKVPDEEEGSLPSFSLIQLQCIFPSHLSSNTNELVHFKTELRPVVVPETDSL